MKLYQIISTDSAVFELVARVPSRSESMTSWAENKARIVRSNMPLRDLPPPAIDFREIERQARAARSAWFGDKFKSVCRAVARWVENPRATEMEHYLAASQNLADLEQRIRRYERMQPQ